MCDIFYLSHCVKSTKLNWRHGSGINLLIHLLARKQIRIFTKMSNYFFHVKIHLNRKTGTGHATSHSWASFLVGCCIYIITTNYWLKCNIMSRYVQQVNQWWTSGRGFSPSPSNSKDLFLQQPFCKEKFMIIEVEEHISTPAVASVDQNALQPSGMLSVWGYISVHESSTAEFISQQKINWQLFG